MADAPASQWPLLKLETNIALVGTVKYADYQVGRDWKDPETGKTKRLSDQLKLRGFFAREGQPAAAATVYVGLAFIGELCAMGVLEQLKENDDKGNPRWNVVATKPIRIVRREEGRKKPVHIHWVGEPEGAPAGVTPPAAAKAAPAAPTSPASTPRAERPGKLQTATEIERDAALQLLKSAKAARRRLGEFSTTFEACFEAARVNVERHLLNLGEQATPITPDTILRITEKIAVHFSIQMAQEHQHVVTREQYAELRKLAGAPDKSGPTKRIEPPSPTTPVPQPDETRLSDVNAMELGDFPPPDEDDDGLPY